MKGKENLTHSYIMRNMWIESDYSQFCIQNNHMVARELFRLELTKKKKKKNTPPKTMTLFFFFLRKQQLNFEIPNYRILWIKNCICSTIQPNLRWLCPLRTIRHKTWMQSVSQEVTETIGETRGKSNNRAIIHWHLHYVLREHYRIYSRNMVDYINQVCTKFLFSHTSFSSLHPPRYLS